MIYCFFFTSIGTECSFLKTKHETEKTKTQTKKWPAGQYVNNKLKVLSVYDVLTTYQVLYGFYLI